VQHVGQAGAVSLSFETLWTVVRDIVLSLYEHDIRHVAVINNHGSAVTSTTRPVGNFIVKTAVRQLNYENPGLTALWVQPFAAGREALQVLFPSACQDVHAGAVESSILMHLLPTLVGPLPIDHVSELTPTLMDFFDFHTIAPGGVWGRPSEASAEKGKLALDAVVRATAEYIELSFKQLYQIKGCIPNWPDRLNRGRESPIWCAPPDPVRNFHAREILHMTFDLLLMRLGIEIKAVLLKFKELYNANPQMHFRKHLDLLI
jgi:creatinine amidohydrolase/Fe(II)-dependent formamide hydrolase-like protein